MAQTLPSESCAWVGSDEASASSTRAKVFAYQFMKAATMMVPAIEQVTDDKFMPAQTTLPNPFVVLVTKCPFNIDRTTLVDISEKHCIGRYRWFSSRPTEILLMD